MMPIYNCNNDHNINRIETKMSELFSNESDGKLTKLVEATNCLENNKDNSSEIKSELNLSCDHMYTSNTENGELNSANTNYEDAESEVKFWKEWLILHLDLIQQQSDEILNKERTILILQKENEMLKERLSCLERGAPFQPKNFFSNHSASFVDEGLDMTQDSMPCDEDNKNCLELLNLKCENGDSRGSLKEKRNLSDGESQIQTASVNKFEPQIDFNKISEKIKADSEIRDCNSSAGKLEFTIDNSSDLDPMRNLRMSIRRKRLSNSSAVSNNDSVLDEKRSFRKFKKRRKRVLKDSQILMTKDHYITQANKTNLHISNLSDIALDIPKNKNLEVPRWRIKIYASCYAMEGTENLDDEVYNKRHIRLENDERRRKRWDVQRIREQRLIEKLKQRQERMGSGSRSDEQSEPLHSFWPNLDDIKYLDVSDQLPVSAFGSPIPKILPSDFSLPWLNNPSISITKKVPVKRSTVRRRNTKR